jgi:hypothetical protein
MVFSRVSLLSVSLLTLSACSSIYNRDVGFCGLECSAEAVHRSTGPAPDPYAHLTPSQGAAMRAAAAYNVGQAVKGTSAGVSAHPAPVSAYGALGASGIIEFSRCKIDRAGNRQQVAKCYDLLPVRVQADMIATDQSTLFNPGRPSTLYHQYRCRGSCRYSASYQSRHQYNVYRWE